MCCLYFSQISGYLIGKITNLSSFSVSNGSGRRDVAATTVSVVEGSVIVVVTVTVESVRVALDVEARSSVGGASAST
jgi:hypothetical protein